jgi:hypothetical protein
MLRCEYGQPMKLTTARGEERLGMESPSLGEMVRGFSRWAQGDSEQIVSTLEGARAHALVISGASDATAVRPVGTPYVRTIKTEADSVLREIPGIQELCLKCAERGELFHESGLALWSEPGGQMSLEGYRHFTAALVREK